MATVFNCVASRNKRAHRAFCWQPLPQVTGSLYPILCDFDGRSLRGPQQRQLRASAAGGFGPRDSASRRNSANKSVQFAALNSPLFFQIRPVAHSPRAAKPLGDEAGDPKGLHKHCPQLAPVLGPVSTSLRLRFRSAAAVARWDFISILLSQNE